MNILNQMALPLVVALGLTFVIMLGSIDLSIDGSVGMAGSLFACFVLNSEFAYDLGFLSVVIAVGVSMLCGLLIGLCHVYLKIPPSWPPLPLCTSARASVWSLTRGILPRSRTPLLRLCPPPPSWASPLSPGLPL
ncbi:hypothetical protein M5E87_07825 [Flavonifractor plautii]|nr:hypothetical protein M5E87_07825 [Flavonifractor plautii]